MRCTSFQTAQQLCLVPQLANHLTPPLLLSLPPQTATSLAQTEVLAAGGKPVGQWFPISFAGTNAKTIALVNAADATGSATANGSPTKTSVSTKTQVGGP
jgi:hypothetical protein